MKGFTLKIGPERKVVNYWNWRMLYDCSILDAQNNPFIIMQCYDNSTQYTYIKSYISINEIFIECHFRFSADRKFPIIFYIYITIYMIWFANLWYILTVQRTIRIFKLGIKHRFFQRVIATPFYWKYCNGYSKCPLLSDTIDLIWCFIQSYFEAITCSKETNCTPCRS